MCKEPKQIKKLPLWQQYGYSDEPSYRADKTRSRRYGISIEELKTLRDNQNNRCAICGGQETWIANGAHTLSIDHDHNTGRVRAFLCNRCNVLLGLVREDVELLLKISSR